MRRNKGVNFLSYLMYCNTSMYNKYTLYLHLCITWYLNVMYQEKTREPTYVIYNR